MHRKKNIELMSEFEYYCADHTHTRPIYHLTTENSPGLTFNRRLIETF